MITSKTTLGGAISVTGTALMGVGVMTQLIQSASIPPYVYVIMWYVAAAGFVLAAVGKGITAYYAADAADVDEVAKAVDSINKNGTQVTAKPLSPPPSTPPAADTAPKP